MKHRKLRIAWSVAWGVLCVLLIALWVRSYSGTDSAMYMGLANFLDVNSVRGRVIVHYGENGSPRDSEFSWGSEPGIFTYSDIPTDHTFWIDNSLAFGEFIAAIPHWSFVSLFAIVGALPWISKVKRFSLRTLLIAMTLVAVALGLIVWPR
jgi:hypothetical protein